MLPTFVFLIIFVVCPLVSMLMCSFSSKCGFMSRGFFKVKFCGCSCVLRSPCFLRTVGGAFVVIVVAMPVSAKMTLLVSLKLDSVGPLEGLFRAVCFLPCIAGALTIKLIFVVLFGGATCDSNLIGLLVG